MGIYTRRGDDGRTGLADGSRVSKASPRVEALGAIDEAASAIGFAREALAPGPIESSLRFAQHRLFNCSSALADPRHPAGAVSEADVSAVESAIDGMAAAPDEWRGFIVASGGEAATRLHLARTVVRRAERRIVALDEQEPVDPAVVAFVNRLSDLIFAAASAAMARDARVAELWDRDAERPKA